MYSTKNGLEIKKGSSISKGGEGEVFNVLGDDSICLKIYHSIHRDTERENKLKYMCSNPPNLLEGPNFRICWPKQVIYEHGKFVGFTMLKAFYASQLPYHLCQPNIPANLSKDWKVSYDRATSRGMISRLMLSTNIIAAVLRVVNQNIYHLVDLKPQNLLVTIDGKISLIDLDSIQVSDGNNILFKAPVSTPEYTPPEAKEILRRNIPITMDWDTFSVGVLIYEILCGIHPYTATAKPPYDNLTTLTDKINNNLTHVTKGSAPFAVIPPPHNTFNLLSKKLQTLFKQIFNNYTLGVSKRPGLATLGEVLFEEVRYYKDKQAEIEKQKALQNYNRVIKENIDLHEEIQEYNKKITTLTHEVKKLSEKAKKKDNALPWIVAPIIIIAAIIGIISVGRFNRLNQDLASYSDQAKLLEQKNDNLSTVINDLDEEISQLKILNQTLRTSNNSKSDEIRKLKESSRLNSPILNESSASYNPILNVSKVEFMSRNDKMVHAYYGDDLTRSNSYYIWPRITYYGFQSGPQTIKLKYFYPNNHLITTKNGSSEYTLEYTTYIKTGLNTLEIEGTGYTQPRTWGAGKYRFEIWINQTKIKSTDFFIWE